MLGTLIFCFLCVFDSAKAVILIFKHATSLRLSSLSGESALTHAEMDFWASKIDLTIQEHLVASSHENTVEQFADFIMATDIGLFILASVNIISHWSFTSVILVFYSNVFKEKSFGFKVLSSSLVKLSYKSIKHLKEWTVDSGLSGSEIL